MKKEFEVPQIEILSFSSEDILTTSNFGDTQWEIGIQNIKDSQ